MVDMRISNDEKFTSVILDGYYSYLHASGFVLTLVSEIADPITPSQGLGHPDVVWNKRSPHCRQLKQLLVGF
jgi:hypothetical protein